MGYVLVVITVFSTAAGVATQTQFHEFYDRDSCRQAQAGIEQGVSGMKGTFGREVFAACYPAGELTLPAE